MSTKIDPLAVVDQAATIGDGCLIGPFSKVGPHVKIGANTTLTSHVIVEGHTTIGANCQIYPYATIGLPSQDLKYVPGTVTFCVIGDNNIIREHTSVHCATEEGTSTIIGSNCALLAQAHVGHNCAVGDKVILSHAATLGGHVEVGNNANLGGLCAVHQFCNVGAYAMVGGLTPIRKDVLPYTIVQGSPACTRGVNRIGMERGELSRESIEDVQEAYKILFMRNHLWSDAVEIVEGSLGQNPHIRVLLDAIAASERGVTTTNERA